MGLEKLCERRPQTCQRIDSSILKQICESAQDASAAVCPTLAAGARNSCVTVLGGAAEFVQSDKFCPTVATLAGPVVATILGGKGLDAALGLAWGTACPAVQKEVLKLSGEKASGEKICSFLGDQIVEVVTTVLDKSGL